MSIQDKHKIWSANQRLWNYYADAYSPQYGPDLRYRLDLITGYRYVTRYPLESWDSYFQRLCFSTPVDLVALGVDLMVGSISDVQVDIPDEFTDVWNDADLQGTSMEQLFINARQQACIYGHTFILVDSVRAQKEIVTQADIEAQNIRPIIRLLTPQQVINWRLDENQQLQEITYEVTPEQSGSILEAQTEPVKEFRYWSRDEFRVYHGETQVDQGPNPVGVVPVICMYHRKVQPMLGDSLIRHAARYQQKLTNWMSSLDQIIEKQSFAQLCLVSGNTPQQVGLGVNAIVHLQPEHTEGTERFGKEELLYVTPPVAPLELSWNSFYRVHSLALTSMCLPGDVLIDRAGKGPESGVARSYNWKNTDKRLSIMAKNEEQAVRQVMDLCGLWLGEEFKGNVQYPTTFDLSSIDESISNLLSLQSAGVPPTARKALMMAAIAKALPRLDRDTAIQIQKEMDEAEQAAETLDKKDPADYDAPVPTAPVGDIPAVDPTELPDKFSGAN